MTFRPAMLRQAPPVVTHPIDGIWEVVIPVARTNLVSNPSFETNTTSWTAIGGSIARSTTRQYHGAYSLAITPSSATTDGARFDTVSLTSAVLYAYSAKVWADKGAPIKLAIETTGGAELASVTARGCGRWQWLYGYYLETSTTTRRVTLRKNGGASTAIIYLDGVQVEAISAGETVSTYLDGDQVGFVPNQQPPAYVWTGTPHASTSTRSGLTRSGGMVVQFKDYGFLLLAIVGLGLATPQNVATEYARIDGGFDDYTRKPIRQFSLVGQFEARNYLELRSLRGALAQLLDRDENAQDQRLLLRYRLENSCGDVQSDVAAFACKYVGGLDGQMDSHFAQATTITFTQYLPLIGSDNEIGASLGVQTSVSNANNILYRSPAGVWQALGTGATGATTGVGNVVQDTNGNVYVTGDFTAMGGVANTASIAKWSGGAWSALGSGATGGLASAMALDAQQRLYVGGAFTGMGGVANTAKIARWSGSAWSSITGAGAANGTVNALAVAPDGTVYAGGAFTSINGVAASKIAKLDPSSGTWSIMGTGAAGGDVASIVVDAAGNVYAAGSFTSMGGVANTLRIAKWDGSAWTALGTGLSGTIAGALSIDSRGILYAGGDITNAGGVTVNYIAQWNGAAWSTVDGGVTAVGSPQVSSTSPAPEGLYLTGIFTSAGDADGLDSTAIWNGGTFIPVNIDLPGGVGPLVNIARRVYDGGLYLGFNQTGTATAPATTTITNTGTARSYPTLVITGPTSGSARIYQLVNQTTGRAIYLNNLVMLQGETARLVLQPDAISFTSDFRGNLAGYILPGSNESDFFLQPGTNVLSFFTAGSTVTATIYWRPNFASLDDIP